MSEEGNLVVQVDEDSRAARVLVPDEPLIGRIHAECTECWGCVRHCPARALKVVDGCTEVIEQRCVKCGACVTECGAGAHRVRDDLGRVRELLASETPVVMLLASEHVAALHPWSPSQIERMLDAVGVMGVETTVLGEELVAAAYEQTQARAETPGWPRLRSTCPVCVDWVRKFYPELTSALLPVVPPYVAQARLVRKIYPEDVALVYVSPCWARKDEVYEASFLGEIDVAIGFDELRTLLEGAPEIPAELRPLRRPQAVKQLSVTDGFPRRTLTESDRTDRDVVAVRGLSDLDSLLKAIMRGEACPVIVDMLNCEGCIDGPCVNRDVSVFAKRNIDLSERERQAPAAVDSRTFLSAIPSVELKRTFRPDPVPAREPSDEEIDLVLKAGEFASRTEVVDCGACGYDTCVKHAAAICLGNSTWEMCFPLAKKKLVRERELYASAAVTDDLTGLNNRRAFDERLAEEVARASRYGSPLSLAMLDLDGFKQVNDNHGHNVGDSLLRAVGVLLKAELRATDIAVRYGGDEFALILPNTPKTDAWAVAEKVRSSLRTLAVDAGEGVFVGTTASLGVASHGEENPDLTSLLQSADAALYRAKRAGRDRVEIAAG